MILAIDPGVTNGWAVFTGDGKVQEFGQGDLTELYNFCTHFELVFGSEPSTVIIESYRVLPTARSLKANVGSKLETVEAIGLIKSFALGWNCTVVEQEPGIKKIASMWTGIKVPGNHAESHRFDAMLHGFYFLIKNGILALEAP